MGKHAIRGKNGHEAAKKQTGLLFTQGEAVHQRVDSDDGQGLCC